MTKELLEWLNTPCDPADLLQLEKDVYYMPIGTVKQKLSYMEKEFGVKICYSNFNHLVINTTTKKREPILLASGSIELTIHSKHHESKYLDDTKKLVGAATITSDVYGDNIHYAATLKSLCIVNALSSEYPQFGYSSLFVSDVVSAEKNDNKPAADMLIIGLMIMAMKNKKGQQIKELLAQYSFDDKTTKEAEKIMICSI